MLKLKNIVKNYLAGENEVHALKDVNIEFCSNEFVAILGHSGCGKTTLLNIIGGLDRYTSGDLLINGVSTKEFNDYDWDSYRNHSIGFVFQSYNLISHLTVLGNVELALTLSGVSKEERVAKAKDALDKVGLKNQYKKLPNQLSGGQMQRVAIARALVNDPEILLADEPTGALDTTTSVQIMDILKEISKDKLVIMVTHNSSLADQYASRIVHLSDGEILSDSKPTKIAEEPKKEVLSKKDKKANKQKTSMSFLTALSLSAKNLVTKKGRAILTAFAGSIGIIGIALVLSLSNGFNNYISRMQSDTMSSYPLTISDSYLNTESFQSIQNNPTLEKYPEIKKIIINKISEKMNSLMGSNNITKEYIDECIETIDKTLINGIVYDYGTKINVYRSSESGSGIKISTRGSSMMGMESGGWSQIMDNDEFIKSQYDIIAGNYPQSYDEIVVVVDEYNRISDSTFISLGLSTDDVDEYSFEEILALKFKLLTNNQLYTEEEGVFKSNVSTTQNISTVSEEVLNSGIDLKVVGILRVKESTSIGSISNSVAYLTSLENYVRTTNIDSELVKAQLKAKEDYDNGTTTGIVNVTTGTQLVDTPISPVETQYNNLISGFGYNLVPETIKIYPIDFGTKESIKTKLNEYNLAKENEDKKDEAVYFTDEMAILVSSLNTMVDAISYVLIAFTAISLVVSSIMIAIITYVSVIERTKEIGILRSIGARKKDITRVFNAETFIIGLVAGLLGVFIAFLANFPINLLLSSLLEGIGNLAELNIIHALVLVVISICLTLLSGLIPSRMASKKDPVVALRTE